MNRRAVTGTAIFLLLLSSPLFAHEKAVKHVQVNPISADRIDAFVGIGKSVVVEFINESGHKNVEVFPEPPITVTHSRRGTRCTIDGGVWVRNSVFLCKDENILILQEFSGSNDFLNFHDTKSCVKLRSIDVSNAKWAFVGPHLVVKKAKEQKIPLKNLCRSGSPK